MRKCPQSRLWAQVGSGGVTAWPEALKREIVAASFAPGSSVSVVARQYDVNANQVFGWRRRYREAREPPAARIGSSIDPGDGHGGTGGRGCGVADADRVGDDRDRSCRQVPCPRRRLRCAGTAARARCAEAAMIPVPSGVRVWLAVGRTDMRRGMNGLALQVQEALRRDPHAGDLYVFRGARGDLIKILWHDGLGMSLYAKRLEKGRFIWPSACRRRRCDLGLAIGLHARRNRLAQPGSYLPSGTCGIVAAFCERRNDGL